MNQSSKTLVVQSLLGKNQIDFYIRCLNSLFDYCQDSIDLLLHSDGTLSEDDQSEIISKFKNKNVSFSIGSESIEKTLDQLTGRPNCQKIRRNSIWGIEFFDPLFSFPDDNLSFYIDADIIFIKPFKGLFCREKVTNRALFLQDTQWDAYSLRPWQLAGIGKKPKIVKGITTAFVCWDKTVIDWDYLEWFLGQKSYHKIPEWVMPTSQAGLAAQCGAKAVTGSQILNMYPNAKISENTFGLHLLGSYRKHWLSKFPAYDESKQHNSEPILAKFEKCKTQNALGFGLNQAKRWINTRLNKW